MNGSCHEKNWVIVVGFLSNKQFLQHSGTIESYAHQLDSKCSAPKLGEGTCSNLGRYTVCAS